MSPPQDEHRVHRRHPVYSNLILIDAPVLSEVLLSPRDISAGGFLVESPNSAEVGDRVECTIEIQGKFFSGCQATLAWLSKNDIDPPTWNLGFSLKVPDEHQSAFDSAMEAAFPDSGEMEEI